jgi:tetraacyldisaccharide-1-P 4'-kinase
LFNKEEINFPKNDIIIMTEKDAVKCETFANSQHFCLPLQVTMDQVFVNLLKEKLVRLGILNQP